MANETAQVDVGPGASHLAGDDQRGVAAEVGKHNGGVAAASDLLVEHTRFRPAVQAGRVDQYKLEIAADSGLCDRRVFQRYASNGASASSDAK